MYVSLIDMFEVGTDNAPDQQAIETLLSLAETYAGHGKTMGKDSHGAVKGAHDDDNLNRAEADLKVRLLSRADQR